MNLFDKLAVSLLVCFGMMLSQIEAAMPGAFSRVAIADDWHEAYEVTQDDSFQGYAEFFLLFEIFSGSYEGYEGAGTVLWQAGTYDSQGRSLTQTLAQGVTTAATYDSQKGDLKTLTASRAGSTVQQKAYSWDNMGNLTSRTDHIAKRHETFGYDHLNRLSNTAISSMPGAVSSTVPPPQTYSYDIKGNLLTKGTSASLTYASATRPHAITAATVKGFNRTYSYDSAGYVVSDSKRTYQWTSFGQLERLEYQSAPGLSDFVGGLVHAAGRVETIFDFDAGGNRARQTKERTAANDSRKIESTLHLGSYEREIHTTKTSGIAPAVVAKTVHRHSLPGGAIYTRTLGGADPGVFLSTVLKDHLGSTDLLLRGKWNGSAFSTPTIERQSFDPWGERRAADTQVNFRTADSQPFRTSTQDYDRGYTGHEQLDDSGLIHMNGRIYDPELGRFLSPDPYVQIPEYSQNFNRYSYVLNNPLNATDPSGFSFLSKIFGKIGNWIKENWRTIVSIVVGVALFFTLGPGAFGLPHLGLQGAQLGAAVGASAGAFNAAINGGDLADILRGAVIGGIQGGITGGILHDAGLAAADAGFFSVDSALHIAGHGVVGGAANEAMGGKFQDGFLSAAISAAASNAGAFGFIKGNSAGAVAGRTAVAGIVGGTASVLGGGKFANGAYTSAFQHLLNAEVEKIVHHMKMARSQLGVAEHADGWNPKIKDYQNSTVKGFFNDDGTGRNAWCACFVNWVLGKTGITPLNHSGDRYNLMRAKEYEKYGQPTQRPSYGSIGVKKSGSQYHVGFIVGINFEGTHIIMLGGNQSDSVNYSAYPIKSFTAFRVPYGTKPNIPIVIIENMENINGGGSTR